MLKRETLKEKISERVLDWIKTNNLVPGDRLLSEKNIAKLFGVNHLTVRAAFTTLEKDGYIERRPRSGTYVKRLPDVVDPTKNSDSSNLVTILMRNSGHTHADLVDCLCRKLQAEAYVPLVVPLPLDHDYGPTLEHIRKTWEMGSNKLIVGDDFHLWLEPISSRIELHSDQNQHWRQIVWLDNTEPPNYIAGDVVGIDNQMGASKVINYLKDLGHRKIAFLTHNQDPEHPFPKHQGYHIACYETAMREAGLNSNIRLITQGNFQKEKISAMKEILTAPDRPTAIFAAMDFRLISVYKAAMEIGLQIPEDLALFGNYDTPWAKEYLLSSISAEIEMITDKLLSTIALPKSQPGKRRIIKIQPDMSIRDSTEPQEQIQREDSVELVESI